MNTTSRRRLIAAGTAVATVVALAATSVVSAARDGAARSDGIVYARGFDKNAEIYVKERSGVDRRLTRNSAYDGFPSWSPDRKRVVFVSTRGGRDSDVYVMNADGTDATRLTRGGGQDLYPAFSPDGKLIAFSSDRVGGEPEIYVIGSDGKGLRRLTTTPRYVQDVQPRFSPSGRYIVFASNRVAYWNFEIYRMRASDGRGLRRLTHWGSGKDGAPGDDAMPSYSPNGKRIAFVSDREGGYGILTMKADGTQLRKVVQHRRMNHAFPRFSPDGRRIVYITFAPEKDGRDVRLHAVSATGTGGSVLGRGSEPDW